MVNGEIRGNLYRAYRINELWVGLQWVYSGSTVGLQRTKDEQKTNDKRRNNECKVEVKWRRDILKSFLYSLIFQLLISV